MTVSHLWDRPKLGQRHEKNIRRAAIVRAARKRAESAHDRPDEQGVSIMGQMSQGHVVLIHDAATAGLVRCGNCERGFRRIGGEHIGSQRMGMIPNIACKRVFAVHGGNMTDENARPWMAYVDGEPLRRASGDARRFSTAAAAYRAACSGAPMRWHE